MSKTQPHLYRALPSRCVQLMLQVALLALLLSVGWSAGLANAQEVISVQSQSHEYSFGQYIVFDASFSSTRPVSRVSLLFAARDDTRVFQADLPVAEGATEVPVAYRLDLTEYPMRPFVQVEYWWYIETSDGYSLETDPVSFLYSDSRYSWRQVDNDSIHVFWVGEDTTLGHTVLRYAQDGLARMQNMLPASIQHPINIYIYPSQSELVAALRLAGREWISGHADPEWGVILVSDGSGGGTSARLERVVAHEVAHFAIYHSAGDNNQVPIWLHEGLAVGNEPQPDPIYPETLEKALAEGDALPMTSLCSSFPYDQTDALLAYAQSDSLVRFLKNQYGHQLVSQLIAAYGDGADCSGGVERVIGLSLAELETQWLVSLDAKESSASPAIFWQQSALWIALLVGATALAGALFLVRPRPSWDLEYYDDQTTQAS